MDLEKKLQEHLSQIKPLNEAIRSDAFDREQQLTKPRGALGRLEDIAIQMAAIQNTPKPRHENKLIVVCAGDHGIVDEGVAVDPKSVTFQQLLNFEVGGGAITVLGRRAGAKVILADIGVDHDFAPLPNIINCKIAMGTKNMAKGPAMTRDEAILSILTGINLVLREQYVDIVAAGEMGIGNTSPSTAIISCLTGMSVEDATGKGAGLPDDRLAHKAAVIKKAIELNKPNPADPLDVLAKVGGLEIGAMVGVYLGGAIRRAGIVIDGFIAGAAALLAEKLSPGISKYFIAGHRSLEKAHLATLEHLNLKPILDLDMRLGEGSGAAIAMFIVECAVAHHNEMRTFAETKVADVREVPTLNN